MAVWATEDLLNDNDISRNYQYLIEDVIYQLHGGGVYLGLIAPNRIVQGAALRRAGLIFKESAEIEEYLYGLLEEFLDNSNREISLIINAAEIINTATDLSRRLKTLSKLLLEETELRNLGVRLLTPYKQELARVEPDADTVLDALVFSYSLDTLQKHELQDLTISQLETEFSSASQDRREILVIFTSDIAASESLTRQYGRSASVLKQFLQNEHDEYLSDIQDWLWELKDSIDEIYALRNKLDSNYRLLEEVVIQQRHLLNEVVIEQRSQSIDLDSSISPTLLYYTLTRSSVYQLQPLNISECQIKNQCQTLASELKVVKNKLKDALISRISALESTKRREIYAAIILLFFFIPLFMAVSFTKEISLLAVATIFFLIIFILICIWTGRNNNNKQEIIYFLRNLTNNWQ